jgi:hypothetical protein
MGTDGDGLSCPGSGEVAKMGFVDRRDSKLDTDTETIEPEQYASEKHQAF